uniref:Uncharacterized protein n=1 Tax=Panagrolaimus sp. JU765 TaxID=591449 RepID=A0AC34R7Y0_9BILA
MTMKMDKIIVKYLTDCCLPPTHLHDHGFVHFLKELVPHYELKSKEYFCVDAVDELYHICKYKIKNELQNVEWFTLVINFTDSGHQNHAVYFRDRNFNLKHFVISSIIPTFPGLYGIKSETLFDHDIPLEKLVTIIHNEIRGHDIFDMKPYSFFCEDIVEILTESLERGWSFVVPDLVRNNRFIQRNDKFKTLVLTNPELESLSQKISTNSFADWNDKTTLKWDEI